MASPLPNYAKTDALNFNVFQISVPYSPMSHPQTLYHRLNITPDQITQFCQQHHIIELSLFGSILRDDFTCDSDIDILVVFDRNANPDLSLMDLVGIQYELEEMVGRKVDLIEKRSILDSDNWIRRQNILNNAQVFYESKPILSTGY